MRILAIDPGNTESGWVIIDADTCRPLHFGKDSNVTLRESLLFASPKDDLDHVAIEMVASYGMAVGADVFETCVWIGRYIETVERVTGTEPDLVKRHPVKVHHCHSAKAKDSNITQALVDRFAPGQPNHGKGTKAAPGWFYGFRADVWQAYALAVYTADTLTARDGAA
ncbi:hypothetical protein ACPPVT_07620 [Angustibacter sp. McL0619]|uniref:hypothetical protein n=1 Tax=Angustibacter sp. McL0619 TaxID=3415676 RepID=UPI003CF1DF51